MNKPIRLRAPGLSVTPSVLPRFVHLRVHSAYSLLEGALPISTLAKLALANGFPAVALTDTNNLFGALEFSETLAEVGIQPVVGLTLSVDFKDRPAGNGRAPQPRARAPSAGAIAAFASSERGYLNLMKLASAAHFDPGEEE